MNILITGGAGYLGFQVVKDFLDNYPNSKIIVYDNLSRGRVEFLSSLITGYNERLVIIPNERADIRDFANFEAVLKEYSPEIVVNLAAIVDAFSTNRPGKDLECDIVNREAAIRIARISKNMKVKIFVQQSSVSVYSKGEELKENSEKNPLSVYGKSKLDAEKEILEMNSPEFGTIILRSATLVGYTPGFTYQTIINLACIRAIYDVPIIIFESAWEGRKTFLDVKDESRAINFVIKNINKTAGEIFNVSSFHTSLKEVIHHLEQILGRKINYFIKPEKTINQQVYTINSDKIKSLGFSPEGNLEMVLESTIKKLLDRRRFFEEEEN